MHVSPRRVSSPALAVSLLGNPDAVAKFHRAGVNGTDARM